MRRRVMLGSLGLLFLPALAGILAGCASSGTSYVNPDVDFGYMQRAAVLPFQNLTSDDIADERLHSIFVTEILKEDILEIVDSRETVSVMRGMGLTPGSSLTPEQTVALGDKLVVDALFFGVVEEYGPGRGDRRRGPEITAVFGMTETETGAVVWRSQVHSTGSSLWRRLFGGGAADLFEVSRDTVRKALRTLL